MKLVVQGIEEIEITDPQGLCQLSALPQLQPAGPRNVPVPSPIPTGIYPQTPRPAIPVRWGDPSIPGAGAVAVPHRPIYTRHVCDPEDPFNREKWGIGDPMIQQKDADKWGKNWQSKVSGAEGQEDGNQYTS